MKHNQHILLAPSDYPLIASPTLAKAYGVAAATFLQKLHYCLETVSYTHLTLPTTSRV